MRFFLKITVLFILFSSCQTDDDTSGLLQDDPEVFTFNPANHDEYIYLEMENRQILFSSNTKFVSDDIGTKLNEYTSRSGQRYKTLKFWGVKESMDSRELIRFGGTIENYRGIGVYTTGKEKENNCHFFDYGVSWQSHYDIEEEGFIKINSQSENYVEGELNFKVYNSYSKTDFKEIEGKFRLTIN